MRYLRAKGIRKALRQFHFLCGIKPPYKVLVDGNFLAMCLQMKVDVRERVPKFLQVKAHQCEFYIARAAVNELELLGDAMREAVDIAKSFRVIEERDYSAAVDDVKDVTKVLQALVGERNERKFVVATQEVELRKALRLVPGVPLIYLNRSVLVFEDVSKATLAIVRQEEKAKMAKLDVNEKRKLESVVADEDDDKTNEAAAPARKKHRAKAPNPLSCKKPTTKKVRSKKKKKTMMTAASATSS